MHASRLHLRRSKRYPQHQFNSAIVVDIMNDNTAPPLLWRGGWGVRPKTSFTLFMSITIISFFLRGRKPPTRLSARNFCRDVPRNVSTKIPRPYAATPSAGRQPRNAPPMTKCQANESGHNPPHTYPYQVPSTLSHIASDSGNTGSSPSSNPHPALPLSYRKLHPDRM